MGTVRRPAHRTSDPTAALDVWLPLVRCPDCRSLVSLTRFRGDSSSSAPPPTRSGLDQFRSAAHFAQRVPSAFEGTLPFLSRQFPTWPNRRSILLVSHEGHVPTATRKERPK
jgi:hypothetical protein